MEFYVRKKEFKETIFLVAISLSYVVINVIWLWMFRRGQPYNIDEYGYLGIALNDFHALMARGIVGWMQAVESPSIQSPITTALSSLTFVVFGPRPLVGFAVTILSGIVTIIASFYIGKRISGSRIGLIASVVVASSPIIINGARDYIFALPVTAVTTVAILALLYSDRFRNRKFAVLFGVFLGLMPLTRTMTIAFVPALVVAALISVSDKSVDNRRRWMNLLISFIVAIVTASTWLVPNGMLVMRYLLSFGYGNRSVEYGPKQSLLNLDTWLYTVQNLASYVYLPELVFIILGFILFLAMIIRMLLSEKWTDVFRVMQKSNILPLVILIAEGLIALTSSRNKGSAFVAPLVPAMLVLSSWSITKLIKRQFLLRLMTVTIVALSIISCIPLMNLTMSWARPWNINVPILGLTTVTDGRDYIQIYEAAGGYSTNNPDFPISKYMGEQWVNINEWTANKLNKVVGINQLIAFGYRGYMYNVNSVNYQQLLAGRTQFLLTQIAPEVTGNTVEGYQQWLTKGGASSATFLLTGLGHYGIIMPVVNTANISKAAVRSGFSVYSKWRLPDGTNITLWKRSPSYDQVKAEISTTSQSSINLNSYVSLPKLNGNTPYTHADYNLEVINGQRVTSGVNSTIPQDNQINFIGWAVDQASNRPAKTVILAMNGKPVAVANYGIDRPDVAASLKDPKDLLSGFTVTVDKKVFQPGINDVSLWIVNSKGNGYYSTAGYEVIIK